MKKYVRIMYTGNQTVLKIFNNKFQFSDLFTSYLRK